MTQYTMTGASQDEVWPLIRDYHYSRSSPAVIRHRFAWRDEGGLFGDTGEVLAAAVYGTGNINMPGDSLELMRLVRSPVLKGQISPFVSRTIRWLKGNTKWSFIFSYADPAQKHHGGIYQALGFIYVGKSKRQKTFFNELGEPLHKRSVSVDCGTAAQEIVLRKHPNWTVGYTMQKHLYFKSLRQRPNSILKKQRWKPLPFPKPDHANCPLDEPLPSGVSREYPPEFAPVNKEFSCP